MSLASYRGILNPLDIQPEVITDLSALTRQIFINRTPVVARIPRRTVGSQVFQLITSGPRRRHFLLGAAVANAAATVITFNDVSVFMPGDVIDIGGERVEVVSNPTITNTTTGAGTVEVVRGVEGTLADEHDSGDPATLISNTRRGNEVDQEAYRTPRKFEDQYVQTWQFPVQVGGLANALKNVRLPSGDSSVFTSEQKEKLIDMVEDMEFSTYYGIGESPAEADTTRAKQKGLRTLIDAGGNLTVGPTNAAAYKPTDLIRDVFERSASHGGRADVLLISDDFMGGFAKWGFAALSTRSGENVFGTPIEVLEVPFLNRQVQCIPCPLLSKGTAVGLTSEEVHWAQVRPESWKPRGSRGDAEEGDWLATGAIELENLDHHAWVEGITGFAPES